MAGIDALRTDSQIAIVYRVRGLLVGISEMTAKSQREYLATQGSAVIILSDRLASQVTAKETLLDCQVAFGWVIGFFALSMRTGCSIELQSSNVVITGRLSAGAITTELVKAATVLSPPLFNADTSTTANKPASAPLFVACALFIPTDEDWAAIRL